MACADSVPGVSGGTIAFILGVYDDLINNIKKLTSFDFSSLKFLMPLGIAWIVGLLVANTVVVALLDEHIYELSSIFLGFIILSIPLTMKEDMELIKNNKNHIIFAVIGAVIVVLISYLSQSSTANDIVVGSATASQVIYVFVCGMIAVSCMLLPGISGSTVMMIFGIYFPLQQAIHAFFTLDFSVVPFLTVFGLGCILGFVVASRVISYVFEKYRSQTIYMIQGLLVGSIYAIIVGPVSLGVERLTLSTFSIIAFLVGCIVMIGLEQIKIWGQKNENR